MVSLLRSGQRAFLGTALLAIISSQMQSCASSPDSVAEVASNGGSQSFSNGGTAGLVGTGGSAAAGGNPATGSSSAISTGGSLGQGGASTATGGNIAQTGGLGAAATGGKLVTGGSTANATGGSTASATGGAKTGGSTATGGSSATGGSKSMGGTSATGGVAAIGGTTSGGSPGYIVSIVQSSKSQAADVTQADITTMVNDAITQAGGLGFIHDGQTVVLKPNLLTHLAQCWSGTATLSPTANGVTTDWRITKAVADLVRAKNPTGKILIMEGSNRNTTTAFAALGYTTANFGTAVDEFVPLEGTGCDSRSQTGLVQKAGKSGKQYWINDRYYQADVIISLGALKSHGSAGITGCVKNVGIGATPNAMYSVSTNSADCSRNMNQSGASSYINHSFAGLGDFISDYYSIKPVDFAIMDGLQGLQNGPCSSNASDRKNMRVILASKNAVALDTVQAAVMNCTGSKVPYLTKLESWGMGTTDMSKIAVVGNKTVAEVRQSFSGAAGGVCN
jgi:uncharacterized protein (DUF362 family)